MPAATPPKVVQVSAGSPVLLLTAPDQPADLPDHLQDRADADRQEDRRPERRVDEGADPGAEDRRPARRPPPAREVDQGRPLPHHRRGDADPLGDVVEGEADDQEDAERRLAEREGAADRQPLAQVVQPDAERDLVGERQAACSLLAAPRKERCRRRPAAPPSAAPAAGSAPGHRGRRPRWPRPPAPPPTCRRPGRASSPTVSARMKFIPRRPSRRRNGYQSKPERDRDDADVEPDQGEAEHALAVGRRADSNATGISASKIDAGRADQIAIAWASSWTQGYGIEIVADSSRSSVAGRARS